MALLFGAVNSNRVDCTSAAAFDNLTALSILVLARIDTLTASRHFMAKRLNGSTGAGWQFRLIGGTPNTLSFRWTRATTTLNYVGADAQAVAGAWRWYAATCDQAGVAGSLVKFYAGPYGGSLTETSSYSTATDGSGAYSSDAAEPVMISNNGGTSESLQGAIEHAVLYTGAVSLVNLQAAIDGFSANVGYTTGRLGEWALGLSGGTAATDVSGNGNNGTVTGATTTGGINQERVARARHRRNH
jgi:hypothetical protein